jgi:hypothetical protein
MPLIIVLTTGKRIDVQGEPKDFKKWKSGRFVEAVEMDGSKIAINFDHVLFVGWISPEHYAAQIAEARRRKEEEQKKNPNPGREPERRIPGGRG